MLLLCFSFESYFDYLKIIGQISYLPIPQVLQDIVSLLSVYIFSDKKYYHALICSSVCYIYLLFQIFAKIKILYLMF